MHWESRADAASHFGEGLHHADPGELQRSVG